MQRQGWMLSCNVASQYLSVGSGGFCTLLWLHSIGKSYEIRCSWGCSVTSQPVIILQGETKKQHFNLRPHHPYDPTLCPRSPGLCEPCLGAGVTPHSQQQRIVPKIRLSLSWPQSVSGWMLASKKESKTLTAGFSSCLLCGWAPGSWVSFTAHAAPRTAHCRTGLSYSPSPREAVSALQYLIFHYSLSNQLFCGSWSRMLLIADTYQANCPFLQAQEHLKMVL